MLYFVYFVILFLKLTIIIVLFIAPFFIITMLTFGAPVNFIMEQFIDKTDQSNQLHAIAFGIALMASFMSLDEMRKNGFFREL